MSKFAPRWFSCYKFIVINQTSQMNSDFQKSLQTTNHNITLNPLSKGETKLISKINHYGLRRCFDYAQHDGVIFNPLNSHRDIFEKFGVKFASV